MRRCFRGLRLLGLFTALAACENFSEECRIQTCNGNQCITEFVPSGTPISAQTPGDCGLDVCHEGAVVRMLDDSDIADDGNACTQDFCTNGVSQHLAESDGTTCADNNACTQTDTCKNGKCVGGDELTCGPFEACIQGACVSYSCTGTTGLPNWPIRSLGPSPVSLEPVDVNGDGKSDVAVIDNVKQAVSVVFGQGDGSFGAQTDYPLGIDPITIESADLNGDGFADLVIANRGSDSVSVLFNNGNGTFAPRVDYPTPKAPLFAHLADLNGDSKADIITSNTSLHKLTIMYNDGNGGFPSSIDTVDIGDPQDVAVADLNNDGRPDIAVAGRKKYIDILHSDGNGGFILANPAEPTPWYDFQDTIKVRAGDFDKDGWIDLVIAMVLTGDTQVEVLWNRGDGTYAPNTWGLGMYPVFDALAVAPTQNGNMSIFTMDRYRMMRMFTWAGEDDFAQVQLAQNIFQGKPADIDGNGRLDFVGLPGSNGFISLRNVEDSFSSWSGAAIPYRMVDVACGGFIVDDIDGNGYVDIVGASGSANDLAVALNNGAGDFASAQIYTVPGYNSVLVAIDVNDDALLDVVAAGYAPAGVLLNQGNGILGEPVPFDLGGLTDLYAADIDNDGRRDLIGTMSNQKFIRVIRNLGNGAFVPDPDYDLGYDPGWLYLGDIDRDGDVDILSNDGVLSDVGILLNDGTGFFASSAVHTLCPTQRLVVDDLNGDGWLDIMGLCGNDVGISLNQQDGTFAQPIAYLPLIDGASWLSAADLDGDDQNDIVYADGFGDLHVHFNQGNGVFTSRTDYAGGFFSFAGFASDLNGDHKPDLIACMDNEVTLFRNTCLP